MIQRKNKKKHIQTKLKFKYFYKYNLIKKTIFLYNLLNIQEKPTIHIQIKPVLNNLYLSYTFAYKKTKKTLKHFNLHTLDFFRNKTLIINFFLLELLKLIKFIINILPKFKFNLIIELIYQSLNKTLITLVINYFKNLQNFFLKFRNNLPFNGCRLKKIRRKKVLIYYL